MALEVKNVRKVFSINKDGIEVLKDINLMMSQLKDLEDIGECQHLMNVENLQENVHFN